MQRAFGGGVTSDVFSPAGIALLLTTILLMFILPRKHVVIPVMIGITIIPLGQQIYVLGVHWLFGRVIILAGLARVGITRPGAGKARFGGGYNIADKAFVISVISESAGFYLQYMQSDALVNQFGFLIDQLAGYVLLRMLIQEEADAYRLLKWMAGLTAFFAVCMLAEQATLKNVFGMVIGAMRTSPEIREGKIRAQAAFGHSLTAGAFGGTLLPLFILLAKNSKAKLIGWAGVFGSTVMILATNTSTSVLAYAGGLFALLFWPLRKNMQKVRRGFVVFLVVLHLVMKAPVWFLIAHVDLTGSSSGYHRAELVDQFIRHFTDWLWIGTKDSINWGFDMWDQQNQFVQVGETGGLLALVFFIAMISRSFGRIGTCRRLTEGTRQEWTFWLLGAALFSHIVTFFGVNYFDQVKMTWFMSLAIISAITAPILRRGSAQNLRGSRKPSGVGTPHTTPVLTGRY
jgi:hypothetical protein